MTKHEILDIINSWMQKSNVMLDPVLVDGVIYGMYDEYDNKNYPTFELADAIYKALNK